MVVSLDFKLDSKIHLFELGIYQCSEGTLKPFTIVTKQNSNGKLM